MANVSNTLGGLMGGALAATSNIYPQSQGQQGNWQSQWTGTYPITTAVPAVPYQSPTVYLPYEPVIPFDHPTPLHFRTADGKLHSFTAAEAFKLLGLTW